MAPNASSADIPGNDPKRRRPPPAEPSAEQLEEAVKRLRSFLGAIDPNWELHRELHLALAALTAALEKEEKKP